MQTRPGALISALILIFTLLGGLWLTLDEGEPPATLLLDRPATSALERKIGHLIMVGFNGTKPKDPGVKAVSAQLADGKIGGVMLLSRNIQTSRQLKVLTQHLARQNKSVPVFIAVDQEGGRVQRLSRLGGNASWLSAEKLSRKTDNCSKEAVRAYYDRHAQVLPDHHINVNFGPVVDLNLNPDNPVIGKSKRSFSADPETVIRCAAGFITAHQALGVATALKHFPGHGTTTVDSHHGLPVIDSTWRKQELTPYKALAQMGHADMIMMGHLVHQRFSDAGTLPASLSQKGIQAARTAAGPETVLITDDLEMTAVSKDFPIEAAALKALAAGNDIVLFSSFERFDPGLGDRLNAAIAAAVKDGRLKEDQIDRSVTRIKALKRKLTPQPQPAG
ncbi:glycoside hydrolase family 3 N-terminal domain-containing protein [Labrenzia sp. PHM005]|uniref:glycoside hydrolase family 3 N-terminal domain-containing protein n=1 Tax=Labrenzia sp. PHM005 TaxID=2590016 RepID=UPI0011406850|nr:glycoside hydrolase family 3 N-terminal domain-containing protein [Labrenzia sp. PHM005]QDG78840.1 glycoside hydrolase family 3 protein [Labrenzia sp. PHM005]